MSVRYLLHLIIEMEIISNHRSTYEVVKKIQNNINTIDMEYV